WSTTVSSPGPCTPSYHPIRNTPSPRSVGRCSVRSKLSASGPSGTWTTFTRPVPAAGRSGRHRRAASPRYRPLRTAARRSTRATPAAPSGRRRTLRPPYPRLARTANVATRARDTPYARERPTSARRERLERAPVRRVPARGRQRQQTDVRRTRGKVLVDACAEPRLRPPCDDRVHQPIAEIAGEVGVVEAEGAQVRLVGRHALDVAAHIRARRGACRFGASLERDAP